jgi:aminopeptidase N
VALAGAIGRDSLQEAVDEFGPDSPYTKLKNDLEGVDPDSIYSQVPYEKGFLFVALLEETVGRARMDEFLRAYMDRFEFQSITTETFLDFLEEELPGVSQEMGARQWVYEPGVPANEPRFTSARREELQELGRRWGEGVRPDPERAGAWSVDEWLVWFGSVPETMTRPDCDWLEEHFHFNESGNAEILCRWLTIAAASSYEPAYGKIRDFLGTFGRMKFLKPLYKTLHQNPATRALAREIFEEHKELYHPIARGGLESILEIG